MNINVWSNGFCGGVRRPVPEPSVAVSQSLTSTKDVATLLLQLLFGNERSPHAIQWDKGNIGHIALHGITPEETEQVIENEPIDRDVVLRNGEVRTVHVGETDAGRILAVVVLERDGMYRVVTARPSRRNERALYKKYKAKDR